MKKGTRVRIKSVKKYGHHDGLPRSQDGGRSGVLLKPTSRSMEGTWDIKLDNGKVVSIHQGWLDDLDAPKPPLPTPEQLAEKVSDWLFDDHGPFGWNDPVGFQKAFDKHTPTRQREFVDCLLNQVKSRLTEFVDK